ncbi:hypothetical protein ACIRSS_03740 [Amycolatopsis sp. NPDC101161]|uniref:hypothetical protein n=1 Tax=Amycolatopsis sp. NPDC101161 TaxID=3363940 RepID=UPI00381813F8
MEVDAEAGVHLPLPASRWRVTVALLDWNAEPGQQKTPRDGPYRTAIRTFAG